MKFTFRSQYEDQTLFRISQTISSKLRLTLQITVQHWSSYVRVYAPAYRTPPYFVTNPLQKYRFPT